MCLWEYSMSRFRLLLAEDHEMVGQGLKSVLGQDYDVVDIVKDGAKVIAAVQRYAPDILLLDLTLPNRSGLTLLDELRSLTLKVPVLVVTMHADHIIMEAALSRGASGFIPKDASINDLRAAINEVVTGRSYVSPLVPKPSHPGAAGSWSGFLRLTPRQQAVVLLIAQGMTSEQIATEMGVSHHTVNFHRKNIRRQLGVHSDLEMHRYAIEVELCSQGTSS